HRRRLARPPHRGREPRGELGPAAGFRGLRASHRAHRAGRRGREGEQPRGRGGRARARAHREVHQSEDRRRLGRGRSLPARDQAHQRGAAPLRGGEAPAHGRARRRAWRRSGPPGRRWWPARRARPRPGSPALNLALSPLGRGQGEDMPGPHVDLTLPESERALLRSLLAPWRDLLYAPGPGLTSALDPGAYRTSVVIVPAAGSAVRVSSVVAPAFGSDLCGLHVEALGQPPGAVLGSFFDLSRAGVVYALAPDGGTAAAPPPGHAEWRAGGAAP